MTCILNALPGAISQGLIWGIMAIGVYITYKILDVADLTVDGTLADTPVEFASGAACCVVLASGGYPVSYKSGYPISGLDEAGKTATVFHAGKKLVDGQIVTAGGRVLGVTATADTLEAAIDKAYQAADKITFTDMHMRRDIGQRAL